MTVQVLEGDCKVALTTLDDCSIDACVTDPPYELGFMGKSWDSMGIANDVGMWREVLRVLKPGAHLLAFSSTRTYHRMVCAIEDAGFEIRDQLAWAYGSGFPKSRNSLKPAWEPVCVARKPMIGTVANNVLTYGTGAINVDGCKVDAEERSLILSDRRLLNNTYGKGLGGSKSAGTTQEGRWPANLIHDGSEEVLALFPESKGQIAAVTGKEPSSKTGDILGEFKCRSPAQPRNDSGSAARFFYCAKASKADRAGSKHPTVKPVALMQWLVRLVTPPGGTVLDPFAGSGTTGAACIAEGFDAVLIELEEQYIADIRARLKGCESDGLLY